MRPDPSARNRTPAAVKLRRVPSQRRSRARVDRILEAARGLLEERGYDGLSLREVARRAGVPVGTLYQFFPNAPALVRHLGEANIALIDAALGEAFGSGPDLDVEVWARQALAKIHAAYLAAPAFIETWAGMQAHPESRALDNADTLRNARQLAAALRGRLPQLDQRECEDVALAITVAGGAVERMALQLPDTKRSRLRNGFGSLIAAFLYNAQRRKRARRNSSSPQS